MDKKKKTIVTFKALTYDGRIVNKNIPIFHNFEIILAQKWHGIDLPPTSIEQQVMQFLDEQDKTELMQKYEFHIIIDYWVKKPRKKKVNEIEDFMKFLEPYLDLFPMFKKPFEAIISESKDSLFGKRKSNEQKFKEVLNSYSMIMKGINGLIDMVIKPLDPMLEDKSHQVAGH